MGIKSNIVLQGDCFGHLVGMPDERIDLIYLDPPFNSGVDYAFRGITKKIAFTDTWSWSDKAAAHIAKIERMRTHPAHGPIKGLHMMFGDTGMTAYLAHMAERIIQMWRVLKPTGSFWLHCDGYACHPLKILLDAVFGPKRFRNQAVYRRIQGSHNDAKRLGRIHDVILFYTKGTKFTWNPQYTPYSRDYAEKKYRHVEAGTGRRYQLGTLTANSLSTSNPIYEFMGVTRSWMYNREKMERLAAEGIIVQTRPGTVPRKKLYLDQMKGIPLQDIWSDLKRTTSEMTNWPTQKPLALLERIIKATSNEGDVVLDPFCGSGTTLVAAKGLNRKYIGMDLSQEAVDISRKRLSEISP